MADAILNLITRVDRPKIKIDGKEYELRHPRELSIPEFHQYLKYLGIIEPGDSPSSGAETKGVSVKMFNLILADVPKSVVARLGAFDMAQIIAVFSALFPNAPAQE